MLHDAAACHDGDTITIPSGSFHWSSTLTLTKAVKLPGNTTTDIRLVNGVWQGTSVNNTVIIDDVQSNSPLIRIGNQAAGVHSAGGQRITGIDFEPGTGTTKLSAIEINDTSLLPATDTRNKVRVDHCYFGDMALTPAVLNVAYRNYGVMDHCVRHNQRQAGMVLCYWGRNTPDKGDLDFQQPAGFGGPNFFFVEDNWMQDATDISFGGKICFRHNHVFSNGAITSGNIVCHGTARSLPTMRGGRAYEIYNNDFHYNLPGESLDGQDSGSCVSHDNTYTNNHASPLGNRDLANYRQVWSWQPPFYGVDGVHVWDYYATEADGSHIDGHPPRVFFSGTATAGTNNTTLFDTTKNFGNLTGYVVVRDSDLGVSGIASSTPTSITMSSIGFFNNWSAGNAYKIYRVLKIMDQPGLGAGGAINRSTPTWPNQAIEPIYSWNNINTDDGTHINFTPAPYASTTILPGVHYFNDTPKPGYTPYTYPHPLVTGAASPQNNANRISLRRN